MILGTGIDLIEVDRIAQSFQRFGRSFLERILLPAEIEYCLSHRAPPPFIAARFASKEAVSKAFGTGIGAKLGWHDMEVAHREGGQPYIILHGQGETLFAQIGATTLHLSISHTQNHASAVAILEKNL